MVFIEMLAGKGAATAVAAVLPSHELLRGVAELTPPEQLSSVLGGFTLSLAQAAQGAASQLSQISPASVAGACGFIGTLGGLHSFGVFKAFKLRRLPQSGSRGARLAEG